MGVLESAGFTVKTENGYVLACCQDCLVQEDCSEPCGEFYEAINKLAEYEELERNEKLGVIKCRHCALYNKSDCPMCESIPFPLGGTMKYVSTTKNTSNGYCNFAK